MAKKKTVKKKSEGLGDTIEKFTEKTGIKKLVKFVAGEDCGCEERKEKLNKLFSYAPKIECLEENEYEVLKKFFSVDRHTITPNEQQELRDIYNRIFHKKSQATGCSSCVRDLVDRLRTIYTEYEKK